MLLLKKFIKIKIIKFTIFGSITTIATYLCYLLLLNILSYKKAYIFTYLLGIILSFFLNGKFVFNKSLSVKKILIYTLIYISQITAYFFILIYFVQILKIDEKIAPLLIILLLLPVSYLINKKFFTLKIK
jgi:putative flippase GtrA